MVFLYVRLCIAYISFILIYEIAESWIMKKFKNIQFCLVFALLINVVVDFVAAVVVVFQIMHSTNFFFVVKI